MRLSVVIPVYNEKQTIREIVRRVQQAGRAAEILIVDDGSTDGTREVLSDLEGQAGVRVLLHPANMGKGAAVRTGIRNAQGELILVQDADLEYSPQDYAQLLRPLEEGTADAVYGSRFLGAPRRATMFWHLVANQMLTLATNLLYNSILSDMETGYKVFRADLIQQIPLRSNRFDFEPEVTAKLLKRRARIFEVPITFNPREYSEGKKIQFHDAFAALWALIRYRFTD